MQITFSEEHDNPRDCQLIIALTGNNSFIKRKLLEMVDEMEKSYGKPLQGVTIASNGTTSVITPVWDGKTY